MNKEEAVAELLPQIYQHINETVSNAIKSALEQVKNRNVPKLSPGNEDFLSAEQAAAFLKLKLNTIYSKAEKGELPFYRSGKRKLLFSKTELEQYVRNSKVRSHKELDEEAENYLINRK